MCVCVCVCVCVCMCVANFTNKHMILNVVLVIKLCLGCELILSNCIISYSGAAGSSVPHLCVILGCCYNYYELSLFLCVFTVSTAAVYCALSVNMPVDVSLYFCLFFFFFSLFFFLYISFSEVILFTPPSTSSFFVGFLSL